MKEEFIHFDSFILKKNDIIFAKIEDKSVTVTIKYGEETKQFIINFESKYYAEECLAKLAVDTDSLTVDTWKHSLVRQMFFTREIVDECNSNMNDIQKELKNLRKELRKNRLNIKENNKCQKN